jgi:hypothetical protein
MSRNFEAHDAKIEAQNLLVGLAGPSSSGKTFSALVLATGMCEEMGADPAKSIFFIDTENRRGLHYANLFRFKHVPFSPPFGSLDYVAAIDYCLKAGAKVIVIDSMSHEHEGDGGMVDAHAKEVERRSGGDWKKAQAIQMLCWQKPKQDRRKLLNKLTQSNAHFILCYRAKETAKPDPKATGQDKVKQMGFTAITGDEFIFEATISTILKPNSGGVPTWSSDLEGERKSIKVAEQFKWVRGMEGPLTRDLGKRLARWAKGDDTPAAGQATGPRKTVSHMKAEIDALQTLDDVADWQRANAALRNHGSVQAKEVWGYSEARAKTLSEGPRQFAADDAGPEYDDETGELLTA